MKIFQNKVENIFAGEGKESTEEMVVADWKEMAYDLAEKAVVGISF